MLVFPPSRASLAAPCILMACTALFAVAQQPSVAASGKVAYKPVINLRTEVLLPDGAAPRTYVTPSGFSYWDESLPVQRGDKVKLDIFAVTGPSELAEAKVRLDNVKIADLTAVPWNTTIDTTSLKAGYHLVEVWVQTTGPHPQTSTALQNFLVADEIPAKYAVKGTQQILTNNTVTTIKPPDTDSDAMPEPPAYIKDLPMSDQASVIVRSTVPEADAALLRGDSVDVKQPTTIYIDAKPGGAATRYTYALSRGGKTIASPPAPVKLHINRVRIQGRTDTTPGLRPGPVTMWVWGIDKEGHPSAPVKVKLTVLEGAQ
jgi:hypothetical protein